MDILDYYGMGIEKSRLDSEPFALEGIRVKEIITRYLSESPLTIADIGGGTGYYAFWLQKLGHQVSLVDLVPANIEIALNYSIENKIPLAVCRIGNALDLEFEDDFFDIVLLFGPLYHIIKKEDRIKALKEAKRILKKDGILFCQAISKYASLFDGYKRNLILDKQFEKILWNDLNTGIHINDTADIDYFTTAFFHDPGELQNEIIASGFLFEKIIAVESFGLLIDNFKEKWENQEFKTNLLKILSLVEDKTELLGMTSHLMGIGRK